MLYRGFGVFTFHLVLLFHLVVFGQAIFFHNHLFCTKKSSISVFVLSFIHEVVRLKSYPCFIIIKKIKKKKKKMLICWISLVSLKSILRGPDLTGADTSKVSRLLRLINMRRQESSWVPPPPTPLTPPFVGFSVSCYKY